MLFKRNRITKEVIYDCIDHYVEPDRVIGLHIDKGQVQFAVRVDPAQGTQMEGLRQNIEEAVLKIKGVTSAAIMLTAEKPVQAHSRSSSDPHGMNKNPKLTLPIKKIIVVASGKGGVGKSTVAAHLAATYARQGQKTGLLDADIYGPSVPHLVGLPSTKPPMNEKKKLIPFEAPHIQGLKVMSMGFMVDQDTPMIWRGPMVQSGIYQMLRDVQWGTDEDKLDVLIIDMPPGTGDAQLTIAQKIDVDGAVIVSTPQDLALLDAMKAVEMFKKTDVPILGLIENMSTHICTQCGHEEHIFGHGGVRSEAEKRGLPFLGAIPLQRSLREDADSGTIGESEIFNAIVEKLTGHNN